MDERKIDRTDEEGLIDLSRLLREARSVLRRLYWLPLALAAVVALLICLHGWRSYQPMYASEATFTIQVVSGTGSDIAGGGYGYYDKATAEQLGKTFPYLIQSDLMRGKLCRAMGVTTLNGTITAQTVSDTNLFTIRVTSPSAQDAKAILDKVIELYPDVAGYVIGSTSMNLLTQPQAATEPYNAFHPLRSAAKGAAAPATVSPAPSPSASATPLTPWPPSTRSSTASRSSPPKSCSTCWPRTSRAARTSVRCC